MIAESAFTTVFGAVPAGGNDRLLYLCRAAVDQGYAIVPLHPGTKKPMCTLTSREVRDADELAREDARLAGHKHWATARHACGLKHALTERKDVDRVIKRLVKNHGEINIGVELGRSRVIVVDVDTEAENAAFHEAWLQATGEPLPFGMTVRSPGVYADEEWKHKNGGHYWFSLPEGIAMPTADGALKDPTGWVAMWADRQVLVPPSVRTEGPYELIGDIHPAPKWLIMKILAHALERKRRLEQQAETRQRRLAEGTEEASIDVWSADTPWEDLLEPDGWYNTTVPDTCGCDIWTAPGIHASPKSATAHDVGCGASPYDDSAGHLPLHVWTDNPPEHLAGFTKTFSKIQYVALRDHGGDIRAACRAQGIMAEGNGARAPLTPLEGQALLQRFGVDADPLAQPSEPSGKAQELRALETTGTYPDEQVVASDAVERLIQNRLNEKLINEEADNRLMRIKFPYLSRIAARGFRSMDTVLSEAAQTPAEFLIERWLRQGSYGVLGAEYKAGKTWFMLDMALSVASGSMFLGLVPAKLGNVAIMHNEGDTQEFSDKLHAVARFKGLTLDAEILDRLKYQEGATKMDDPGAVSRMHDELGAFGPDLVLIDPWYLSAGEDADGKTLSKMGTVLGNLQGVTQSLGAALIISAHWNQTGAGRGVSRIAGAGLQEWARVIINVAVDKYTPAKPYKVDRTGRTRAELAIDLSGQVSGMYRVNRDVWRDDARDLSSPMHYLVNVVEVDEETHSSGSTKRDVSRSEQFRLLQAYADHPEGLIKGKAIETARGIPGKVTGTTYKRWSIAFDELINAECLEDVAEVLATTSEGNVKVQTTAKYALTVTGRNRLAKAREGVDLSMFLGKQEETDMSTPVPENEV